MVLGLECPKCKKATFVTRTQKVFIVKVALFFHSDHSKPLKQPQIHQILSQNHAKTTGSNYQVHQCQTISFSKNYNLTNFGENFCQIITIGRGGMGLEVRAL